MASAAIDLVVGRVFSALESEASLLGGVGDEINAIKEELLTMQSFLIDAEKKNGLTEGEKRWVEQVKQAAYQVEDIIDEFAYHINNQQVGGKFTRFLNRTFYLPKNLWVRHQIGTKLEMINKTIRAIPQRNQSYGVVEVKGNSSSQNDTIWLHNLGESSLFTNKDDLVGTESETQVLMGWLMDGEPHLTVFSLVGMGGSGKTTLAAKTCTNDTVKRRFGCSAWVTVSQTYAMDDLLKRLVKEFYGATKEQVPCDLSTMAYKDLVSVLVSFLKTRKYLVVLDDVWDAKLLMEMRVVFQDSNLGSRIIVTTRNKDIASFSFGVPSYSHHIEPLMESESWSLFSMKAFSARQNNSCPPEIEPIAQELVRRCKGLPLAIVALGGLMATKRTKEEWSRVLDNLSWQLNSNPVLEVVTKRILVLSFNDLPYRLKHCFLYCSIFPEDYSIDAERLTKLWLAEGFVEQVNKVTPEEVAESYLSELISRNMLQVSLNGVGRPRACKMHDLMRDLALSTSERENFFLVCDGKHTLEDSETRRLSIQTIDNNFESYRGMAQLRSLLVFVKDLASFSLSGRDRLKLLRVLDLEDMPIVNVPTELPYLFNLRYLNLKGTHIKELPKSIGNLHNLETLDITRTSIEKLPSGIAKCKKLRYLVMYRFNGKYGDFKYLNGTRAPSEICNLKKLQVLSCVEAEGDIIKQMGNMTQLRRIGITNVREEDENDLCVSLKKLKLLQLLDLKVGDEEKFLKVEAMSSPPPLLKTLILGGKMEKVPHWLPSLQNLTYLFLHWSRLTDDPLPLIGALPCLTDLRFINAFAGEALCFLTGFAKLECLYLRSLDQTTEIVIEQGVMPDLRVMKLVDFRVLKAPPQGVEYLAKLEELELLRVSKELVDRILGEGAVDFPRVKHIPQVSYSYQTRNGLRHATLY